MSQTLVDALLAGQGIDHSLERPELIETHISWVVLLGDYVYKIKKPVVLGFLDFSTLEKRKWFCEEEIRLNKRTAPDIYLSVVAISGNETAPCLNESDSPAFEYAVKMRRVEDLETLDEFAHHNDLTDSLMMELAETIARFHDSLKPDQSDSPYGIPAEVVGHVNECFDTLLALDHTTSDLPVLNDLKEWHEITFKKLEADIKARKTEGHVRECHGDLHLRNIFTDGAACIPFDCIEFSPGLRIIDTVADLAFLLMDLNHVQAATQANLLLNEYLQHTGDYGCLKLLPYYMSYRALVRAKVDALREDQSHEAGLSEDCTYYLTLASSFTRPFAQQIILVCGLSGSGKTTEGRRVASKLGAIHLRSDVERKRLFKLGITESSHTKGLNIYTEDASERTFAALEELTRNTLNAGYPVIVDATFIKQPTRQRFINLARELEVPISIIHCTAPEAEIKLRLEQRSGDASEAGFDQYLAQKAAFEPFNSLEQSLVLEQLSAFK